MRKLIVLLLSMLLLLMACRHDEYPVASPELVVEGRIDNGRHPVVILTSTVPLTSDYQSVDSLENYVLKWARVTISDGEHEEVMTGKYSEDFFPPYIYTTSNMRGEVGRTYHLQVDYENFHAEAETTIPTPAVFDSLAWHQVSSSDTLFSISGWLHDNPATHDYYKLFTRLDREGDHRAFLSSYLGVFDDQILNSQKKVTINKGRTNMVKDFTPYFAKGDTVIIKLTRVDSVAYDYWRSYEEMLSLSRNPLFPSKYNLRGNVRGALGGWFGYGATQYRVVIGE
ncbi:MAG: DUF4249 domain-containing protein [Prevotella sp.]|nr:DUF4249 domain-containing protein [Prevotella sp.]